MSPTSSPQKTPAATTDSNDEFHHDFQPGDHVIRWTRIVIYPIQVHGVVLSAVEDAVTIVDFGVSSNIAEMGGDGERRIDDTRYGDTSTDVDADTRAVQSLDEGVALEDVVSQKDRDMMKAYEKYEGENKRRINIVSITEMEDIKQWKKVTYGESMNKGWKWWWKSDDKDNVGDSSDKARDKNNDNDADNDGSKTIQDKTEQDGEIEKVSSYDNDAIEKVLSCENDALEQVLSYEIDDNVNDNQPTHNSNDNDSDSDNDNDGPKTEKDKIEQDGEIEKELSYDNDVIEKVLSCESDATEHVLSYKNDDNVNNDHSQYNSNDNDSNNDDPKTDQDKIEQEGEIVKVLRYENDVIEKNLSCEIAAIEQVLSCENDEIEQVLSYENDDNENQSLLTPTPTKTDNIQHSKQNALRTIDTQPSLSTTIDAQPSLPQPPSENSKPPKDTQPPKLPCSDPTHLVLSRVRYLLHDPAILPSHNIFYSNSECIAVWCKTGRWSTLQASIFLHSTAAGQLKSAATLATVVGTTTVTQVVPAGGVAGWFGMTTTTTVGLLSLQPWLIPVLAGYGLIAVGTPLFMMRKARVKWEENTEILTNGYQEWVGDDEDHDTASTIDSRSKVGG